MVRTRPCVFCETNPGSTQEHAWPEWLLEWWEEFGSRHGIGPGTEFALSNAHAGVIRRFQGALTVGGFCRSCNSGWMNTAEAAVANVLPDLILGNSRKLSQREQRRLARWVILKALMFMLSTPDLRVPDLWYRKLFRDKLPAISVTLLACDTFHPGGMCNMRTFSTPPNGFQAVFRIGFAVLNVFGHPVHPVTEDRTLRADFDRHIIVIWPPSATVTFPPAQPMSVQ